MMQSPRRTRQPLSEIVLDATKTLKRPLSPSLALLSPSKKRVLAAEGFSTSPHRVSKHTSIENFPSNSPTPKSTPNQAAKPSKEKSRISFKSSPAAPKRNVAESEHPPTPLAPSLLIPREMPSVADKQSIHWPGFDVHCDAYVFIPMSTSFKSADRDLVDDESDSEKFKENARPRRITSRPKDTTDINPFEDDRPSSKIFLPSSLVSSIQLNTNEEAAVDQSL